MELLKGVLVMAVIVAFDLPDAWGSLRFSQSPRSIGPKSDPASRSPVLSPPGLWNPLPVASPFQSPLGPVSQGLAQEPFGLQEKQLLQGPVKPLDWRYPVVSEVQSELAVDFQLRQPVTPSSVAVQCGEDRVLVEVQQDLFGNGQLIQPTGLSLGGCPVVGQDSESRVLIFEYELQNCNSVAMMNEDELVYTFSLTYTPEALAGTPITRADGAVVGVQCHYQRLQNVSSDALRPTWVPYASTEAGEEVLMFSLKLMLDDWSYQRPSYSYFLGGVINIEASVKQYNHVPLRVFVQMMVFVAAKDGNMEKVKGRLQALMSAVEISEPCNPSLYLAITAPLSRLYGHNTEILQMFTVFVHRVSSRAPAASDVLCELGYLLSLQDENKDARECYSTVLKTDPTCASALAGMIRCQLMCDQLEEATQRLTTLSKEEEFLGKTAEVVLLKAILARKQRADEETVTQLLIDATQLHFSALRGLNYSVGYLQMLDLNFLLQVVRMYLESKQDFHLIPGQTPPLWLQDADMILETIIKDIPGMTVSLYYMAYVKLLLGNHAIAQHLLNLCMAEKKPTVPRGAIHLLQARLHLRTGDNSKCLSCLQSGVSVISEIRDQFQFNLLKARALLRSGELKNAIQCLSIAMNMPGVRRPSKGTQSSLSCSERASVYLELAEALRLDGQLNEATKVLQDGILCFKGTAEETRVIFANVDLALVRDDVDAALTILQNVLPTGSMYIQAREQMALIYFDRKRNEKLYIACYREMSEQLPGPHTSMLLADAFMKIHEPAEAAKIYLEVEKMAPEDTLAKKIGHAFVKAHEYQKAVSYYQTHSNTMSVELSELLLKLKRFEEAQQVLEKALEHEPSTALTEMMNDVKFLRVLVKVLRARNLSTLDVVQKTHALQQQVVCRVTNEHPAELEEQRKLLSSICCDWAREFHLKRDLEMAKQHYTDALNHSPDNVEAMFHLAQLHYEHQELDYSEDLCMKILQLQQNHTAASMLLADTLFWKDQKEEAVKIYACTMERNPDNFHAMAKFLQILHRTGKLDDVQAVFKACEKFCLLSVREPGYNYCKGFYFWHSYQVNEALTHLNKARGDATWGKPALELMIQICLNPDRHVFERKVLDSKRMDRRESEMRLRTAQNLLMTFRPCSKSEQDKVRLLSNLCRIYSRETKEVETAMQELKGMMWKKVMLEETLLVMAQGFLQLKQTPKARNFLKRLSRMERTDANADLLEYACLLLVNMYLKIEKYLNMDKLVTSCIRHNKSCSKAYEFYGVIMESEERYRDAALQYELAWKYSYTADPAVGFRLAFNFLMCENYTRAIDVSRQVLEKHPDYPGIHRKVLTRAQRSLRVHSSGFQFCF